MKWTTIGLFTALSLLMLSLWYIDSWLIIRAIAVFDNSAYRIEQEGWKILISIWPLLLSFGLILGIIVATFFSWIALTALRDDQSDEIARLESQAEKYRQMASEALKGSESAQTKANAQAQAEIALERSELAQKSLEAENLKAVFLKKIQEAQDSKLHANKKIQVAQQKKTKSNGVCQTRDAPRS